MTPEEAKQLPAGAEVLVRAIIHDPDPRNDGGTRVFIRSLHLTGAPPIFINPALIECIAPPKPIQVGEVVNSDRGVQPRTVLAIHAGVAFCSYGEQSSELVSVGNLKRGHNAARIDRVI